MKLRESPRTGRNVRRSALAGFVVLGVVLAVTVGGPQRVLAQGSPLVTLAPPQLHVNPGELCTLSVMVDDAVDSLACAEVYVAFDSTLVRCSTAVEGKLFKQAAFPRFFRWQLITPDTATAVDCVLGYRSFILAPGELVRFVFRARQVGVCPVYLTSVKLWDIDRVELSPIIGGFSLIIIGTPVGVPSGGQSINGFFNYPNPFNPLTTLVLDIPSADAQTPQPRANIGIYTIAGRRVRSVFDGLLPAGRFEVSWDGRDDNGRALPAGLYAAVARTSGGLLRRYLVMVR